MVFTISYHLMLSCCIVLSCLVLEGHAAVATILDEDERMQLARKLLLTTEWIVEAGQKHGEVRGVEPTRSSVSVSVSVSVFHLPRDWSECLRCRVQ